MWGRDGLVKGGYIEFSIVDRKNATQINQIVDELEGDDETNSAGQDKQIGDDDGTKTWQNIMRDDKCCKARGE